jgi:hypothetical protein
MPVCLKCVDDPKARRKPLNVCGILTQSLAEATKRFEAAREAFKATMADVSSGLPHPDGIQRIRSVSRALDVAGREMTKKQALLHAFLTQGVIPGKSGTRQLRKTRDVFIAPKIISETISRRPYRHRE